MKDTLVIIPVYNEEATIAAVFEQLRCHYRGDVLIIDDGSTDRSMEILSGIACNHCKVLSHRTNHGYGASLIDGFAFAVGSRYELTLTMDCDLQHEPQYVPKFFEQIGSEDILSGSRYLDSSLEGSDAPADRLSINREITERLNSVTSYELTDAFCGFKLYRTPALAKLRLTNTGYAFPLQLWMQAWKEGLKVKEMAIPRVYLDATRSFGGSLDDAEVRRAYYHEVIEQELEA